MMIKKNNIKNSLLLQIFFILLTCAFIFPARSLAQATTPTTSATETAADLQNKIASSTDSINELQTEIAAEQAQVNTTDSQAKTLQSSVDAMNLTLTELGNQIKLTQDQINQAELTIDQDGLQIGQKTATIASDDQAIAQAIVELNKSDGVSLLEVFLTYSDTGTFWDDINSLAEIRTSVVSDAQDLKQAKTDLQTAQMATAAQKAKLVTLQSSLTDQQKEVTINKQAEATLLAQTKGQEAAYQKILAQKEADEATDENALNQFEAQLKLVINPNSLPATGGAEFAWPIAGAIRITQLFGATAFARANPLVYDGNGHSGLDIAASIGTPVMAVADGIVEGTGNTDLTCPNASYGQWVFIKHPDGLSSLYAHLSLIKATAGEVVTTGEVIGYSGETGYATGPHLHLGVFASEGIEITQVPSAGCPGKIYTMPAGDLKAYLNPLLYLPTTGYTILPSALQ